MAHQMYHMRLEWKSESHIQFYRAYSWNPPGHQGSINPGTWLHAWQYAGGKNRSWTICYTGRGGKEACIRKTNSSMNSCIRSLRPEEADGKKGPGVLKMMVRKGLGTVKCTTEAVTAGQPAACITMSPELRLLRNQEPQLPPRTWGIDI